MKKKKPKSRPRADKEISSLQAFAQLVGRSVPAIQGYVRAGMPTLGRTGRIHEIEFGPAFRWMLLDIERRHEEQLASTDPRLAEARARKYEAEAELREMDAKRRRAELVSREDVILAGQAHVKAWRAVLLSLASRCVLLGLPRQYERLVASICREALLQASQWKTIDDCESAAVQDLARSLDLAAIQLPEAPKQIPRRLVSAGELLAILDGPRSAWPWPEAAEGGLRNLAEQGRNVWLWEHGGHTPEEHLPPPKLEEQPVQTSTHKRAATAQRRRKR